MNVHSQRRRSRGNNSGLRSRNSVLVGSFSCLSLSLLLLVVPTVEATITVMDTRHRYASRQDHSLGKRLWKGYEYMARLQYVDGNLPLCPDNHYHRDDTNMHMHTTPYNLTVPEDGLPVALLVRAGGGCSIEAKADFVLKNVHPAGLVKYLIIDGSDSDLDSDTSNVHFMYGDLKEQKQKLEQEQQELRKLVQRDEHQQEEKRQQYQDEQQQVVLVPKMDRDKFEKELASYDDDLMDEWIRKNYYRQHPEAAAADDDKELPFYILHVSYHTEFDLLDILLHQTDESKAAGGPRLTVDSRLGTGNLNGTAMLWIAVSALLSACACSILLFAHGNQGGWFQEEVVHTAPVRPTRRRLTREQVKRLLPRYHYDGHCLQIINETSNTTDAAGEATESQENDGLLSSAAAATMPVAPNPVDLELCSICLDEYEVGDKLRCLPCNHVFHGKCIGRWLAERSATCPLCKTDLWEEEEETADEDASLVDGHETGAAGAAAEREEPNMEVQNWLDQLFGVTRERNPVEIVPTVTELQAMTDGARVAQQEADRQDVADTSPRSSWWRRMFPAGRQRHAAVDESAATTLTEPLLQPGDEESPAAPSTTEVEMGTSTPSTPQAAQPEAATEVSAPDPPEQQPRQVSV
jgi:hypothetical protein